VHPRWSPIDESSCHPTSTRSSSPVRRRAPPRRCRSPITPPLSKSTAIIDLELPASHLPGARLTPCHPEPESQRGRRSYRHHGPGLPRVSSRISELFPMLPELVIREPPPAPTSLEACMLKFPALSAGPSTNWSRRNAGATASSSSTLPPACGPSPSLLGAAVAYLRQ
jgi:hypothetical protein